MQNIPIKHNMIRLTYLLKHERKLHPFLRHAFHIQETVEFEIQFPSAVVTSFLAASESEEEAINLILMHLFTSDIRTVGYLPSNLKENYFKHTFRI